MYRSFALLMALLFVTSGNTTPVARGQDGKNAATGAENQAEAADEATGNGSDEEQEAEPANGGEVNAAESEEERARPGKRRRGANAVAVEEVGEAIGNIAEGLVRGIFGGEARPQRAGEGKLDEKVLKQFEQQHGRHLDHMLRTEMHFIRIVADTSRPQYEAIANDGKTVRETALRHFARRQHGRNRAFNTNRRHTDPRQLIAQGLLQSARKHLSAEQAAAYEDELAARKQALEQTAVATTTAKLDHKLILTPGQRSRMADVLEEHWDTSGITLRSLVYGGAYFPDLPDPKIEPILTDTQNRVWRTVNQRTRVFRGFQPVFNQPVALEDEKWDEPDGSDTQSDASDGARQAERTPDSQAETEASK